MLTGVKIVKNDKKTEMIGTRITKDQYKEIEKIAEKDDRTISYIVNKAIEEYLKGQGQRDNDN